MRRLMAFGLALLMLALTACAGSGSTDAPAAAASAGPEYTQSAAEDQQSPAESSNMGDGSMPLDETEPADLDAVPDDSFNLSDGPIFIRYDECWGSTSYVKPASSSFDLVQISAETGESKTIFRYNHPKGKYCFSFSEDIEVYASADYQKPYLNTKSVYSGWALEQLFDKDLTKMAIYWMETDGSGHVGWIDNEGEITDVTEIICPITSDFAARPQHAMPLFSPEGQFVFIDKNKECRVYYDMDTQTIVKEDYEANCENNSSWYYSDPHGRRINWCFSPPVKSNGKGDKLTNQVDVFDAANNKMLLLGRESATEAANGTYSFVGVSNGNSEGYTRFTPATDYRIINAAYSNEEGLVAFEAYRGSEHDVFIMTPTENANPQKLASIDNNTYLVFWK